MLNITQHLQRYGIAIASVMVALLLMLALDPFLELTQASFLLFFGAVTISALYGGWQAGVVATILSVVLVNYFFLAPQYTWALTLAGFLRLNLFVVEGVLISVLVGSLQTAQAQIRRSFNQLKASEAEIKDLNQALQRRVDELQTLFNVIPINIIVAEDPDCQVVRANPAYAKRLQVPPDVNVSVTSPSQQAQLPYRFYQKGREVAGDELPLEYAAKHGVEVRDVEIDLVRQDNTVVNLYGHAVPLFDESGQTRGSIGVFTDITERKRAETALREKEQELQKLSDLMPQFIWRCDAQGKLDYVNQQWVEYSGLTLEQSQDAQQIAEFFYPDDLQVAVNQWAIALETQQPYEIEVRLLRAADQTYRWFLIRCVPQLNQQGQAFCWYGTSTDIHERKLAQLNQQFIKELDFQLRQLPNVEAMQEEVVSRLGHYLKVDRAVWDQVDIVAGIGIVKQDWRRQEIPSLVGTYRISEYVLPDLVDLFHAGQTAVIPDVESYPYTAPFAANLSALNIRASISVPCIYEGRWVATLTVTSQIARQWRTDEVALLQEIVDRLWSLIGQTRAVQALRQSQAQLKLANERFQLAARAVNCLIYDWDLTCDRIERTDGLTRLLGYSLEEAEPTGKWWADRVHPDDLPTLREQAWVVLATEDTFSGEYRVLNKANQYIHMLDQCLVVARDAEGKPTRIVGSTTDISERKRADAELQQRELEFRTLVENTPDIITRYDRDLRHLYINSTVEQAIGVPGDQIVGRTVSELELTYSRLQDWYATVQQVFATGEPCSIETEFPRPDGELRLYQAHFVPELREGGQVTTVVSFARDITEFKRTETSLRESEERLRLAMAAARLGTWDVDLITGKAIWSEQHFTLLGFEPVVTGEASESMWIERIHPDDQERVLQTWQQSRLDHQLYQTEYRLVRADTGTIGWVAALGSFTYDSNGQAVRSLGVIFDITQRKQAEESILQLNQQLQEKVTELQTLLDVIPIGIGIAEDSECHYIRANPAFAQILNLPPHVNTSLSAPTAERPTAFKVYKDGQELAAEDLPLQYAAKHGVDVRDLEVEIIRQDGTVITLLEYASPLFDESGQPRGSIGAFLDITDRKQAEAERQQLLERERAVREEAERANRVKDEFLSILSHELRSPLNPILGWSRLLQAKQFDEARTAQALSTIERNARLQTQLIDDLLDVAKILRGKLNLNEVPVQLMPVVEAALEVVKTAAEAKAILLVPELADIGQVRGDSARLQQIVWNLLSNAVKFTPNGGRVVVRLEQVWREGSGRVGEWESKEAGEDANSSTHLPSHPSTPLPAYAQITVTDTGKGISPEFLPHIFESFRQEDVSITRRYGGLGLGLSIVKYLVDAHGGTITADSPGEGQGATFTVRLPLLERKFASSATERFPPTKIDLTGIKVLAVDDSEDARELLEILLAQYGAETKVVASGEEMLALLSRFEPQVLVCDVGMPDMDGYMLLQRIRSLPTDQGGNTPAIALTAYAKEEDYQRAIEHGFQQHIAKPVDPDRLATAIAELARR